MPLYKSIYGLEILDVQMDLAILSELQEVGQRITCQNLSVIYRYLSFVNGNFFVRDSHETFDVYSWFVQ